jgi:hypothetical protein
MKMDKINRLFVFCVVAVALALPVLAQDGANGQSSTQVTKVPAGQKQKVKGVIVKRDVDDFIVRDDRQSD